MNKLLAVITSAGALAVLAGCTWVSPNPQVQARGIMVLPQDRVSRCQLLSKTQVSVASNVAFIHRSKSDVEKDLQNLAMNQAVTQGGDTVSALEPENNGNQTFGVYKCVGAQQQPASNPPASAPEDQVQTTRYQPPGAVTNVPASTHKD